MLLAFGSLLPLSECACARLLDSSKNTPCIKMMQVHRDMAQSIMCINNTCVLILNYKRAPVENPNRGFESETILLMICEKTIIVKFTFFLRRRLI